ncbi:MULTISPECIES: hypothetical protein [unclassified Rhizobium]|uniref:hypothetical protein n=1 Tax=unclassified Rhizobium TaxID=2613769 RepID=UPI0006F911B3|nr:MULTISPECIES: hypothetical protein [unclassified Rhizobium]KQV43261.1 hypothetical protein ASC86_00045 [Rhizobium sp. Root1212]KRD37446.1 hypothetical protein ASE37_00045 [Rhizobium sp. Root268]
MKLTKERMWWLQRFENRGWTVGHPNLAGIKKWDAHSAALVKMGLIEPDTEFGTANHRITEAGRSALRKEERG